MLRIDRIDIARSTRAADATGFDLDGDDAPDNAGGRIASALHGVLGVDYSALASARLADDVAWHLVMRSCDDDTTRVAIAPTREVGDAVHLTGTRDRATGELVADGDDGAFPMTTALDPSGTFPTAGWLRPHLARLELRPLADGRWEGRLGMAFDALQVRDAALVALAPYLDEHRLFLDILDRHPHDGRITVEEMQQASIVQSLFAPDLGVQIDELGLSMAVAFGAREEPPR